MKEMFIAFIIALVIGSVWNQINGADPGPQAMAAMQSGATCGTGDGGTPAGGGGVTQNGASVAVINSQAQAGQELVVDVDEGSFQGYVLDAREPVLVEFYTDNCPHCTTMGPVLGRIAYNGQGIMRLCKINASKCSALAERYDISGVPAFVLFTEGHMMDSTSGARSFEDMRSWLGQNNVSIPASVSTRGSHQM